MSEKPDNGAWERQTPEDFKRWRCGLRFFETVGNAIVIAYDEQPVLTTDPWVDGDAYFGSWAHDYEIPPAQLQAIRDAQYHWFSHGHPDHLNITSLPMLTRGHFLLSDHYGNRIRRDLMAAGYGVRGRRST
jgi:L-ascorbate metabolism protein UlaG (beta-lactamase superfamily)